MNEIDKIHSVKEKIQAKLDSEYAGLGHFTAEMMRTRQDQISLEYNRGGANAAAAAAAAAASTPVTSSHVLVTGKANGKDRDRIMKQQQQQEPSPTVVELNQEERKRIGEDDMLGKMVDEASER